MKKVNKTEKRENVASENDITIPYGYFDYEGKITKSNKLYINKTLEGYLDAMTYTYYPTNSLSVIDDDKEIFKIETNGDIFLRGKKIGSDK